MAMEDAAVLAEELASGALSSALATTGGASRASRRCASRATVGTTGSAPTRVLAARNRRIERDGRDVERSLAELERLLAYSG